MPESLKSEESAEPIKIFKPFNWEEAERVEAKHQFYHTKDNVFVNFPMKGYSKLMDIRYALSENELLVELKDSQTSKVHRLCKTLNREIDVELSSIELLIDFVAVKLRKSDKEITWESLGYDVKDFTLPRRGQMKSNFLSQPITPVEEPTSAAADKENHNTENVVAPVEAEDPEEDKQKRQEKVLSRMNRNLCYLNLESANQIFKIY